MTDTVDLYALFGVAPTATAVEIAQAYAARVAASGGDPAGILQLNNALQVLNDPIRRADYDASRMGSAVVQPTVVVPAPAGPAAVDATVAVIPPVPGVAPDSTTVVGAGPIPSGDVTVRPETITCPVCSTSNVVGMGPGSEYCQECGFLLTQVPGEGPTAPAATTGPRLVAQESGREYPLKEGANVVGRQDADVLLVDNTVSRVHARLYVSGSQVEVEDASSTNGTRVNGSRIAAGQRLPVGDGDHLQFGQVMLQIQGAAPATGGPTGTIVEAGARVEASQVAVVDDRPVLARLVSQTDGQVYSIRQFPATVGRRSDNEVVIIDPYVSGRHAEIARDNGGYVCRDLGSTNGTVVASEYLQSGGSAPIRPGESVQFGKQRFDFQVDEPAAAEAAPAETAESPTAGTPEVTAGEMPGSETAAASPEPPTPDGVVPAPPSTPPPAPDETP